MIGVIGGDKYFDFRDDTDLSKALGWFGEKYGSTIIIIVDTTDKIKALVSNRDFILFPPNLEEQTKYYLYGVPNIPYVLNTLKIEEIQRNDYLPRNIDWSSWTFTLPFAFINQPVPKTISLY